MAGGPGLREFIQAHWAALSPLFDQAIEIEPAARAAWIEASVADPELREALRTLLRDSEREGAIDAGSARFARVLIDDGAGTEAAAASWIGRTLGPYRIVRLIGEGGMASVFLAERSDGGFVQDVAIKVLRHGMLDPFEQRRFLRERQILARLEHPGIARLIDGGLTAEGVPWFAMEHVQGETITRYCDGRGLGVDARLALFLKVCDAVAFAHGALVVHRDIKPSNILVAADGALKLLDFGIARLVGGDDQDGDDATVTIASQRRLTPAYAAPEQWQGGLVTASADVYALGVLLHELLTGLRPSLREDGSLRPPSALFAAHAERADMARARAAVPAQLKRRIEGDLDMIMAAALHPEPARRYVSVAALADDVRRHLEQRPVTARPDSFAYRAGRYLRRHRVAAIAAALVLASIATGVFATLRQAAQARMSAAQARVEATRAQAVKDFLLGLFEAAAPDRSLGREVTARELLDRGALTLSVRMADTPALRAELQLVLAGIYRELGQLDEAADLVDQAAPGAADAAAVALERGRIALVETRYEAAESALREALARIDPVGEPGRHADMLILLAEVLALRDRRDEAEVLAREAIAMHRRDESAGALALARDQTVLGTIAFGRGDLAAAEQAMREALALRLEALGPTHTQVATAEHDLAVVLLQRGEVDAAGAMFGQALATRRQLLGDDHPDTATTLRNLGAVKRGQNDLATAERYYLEAADNLRRRFPDGHLELAHALNSLAVLEQERGRFDIAIGYLEEAIAGARNLYGPAHPTVGTMLNNLAAMHRVSGDLERAERVQREALGLLAQAVGPRHHLYAVALSGLGFVELEAGRPQAAREHFATAAEVFAAALGQAHPDYAAALTGRSEAALATGDVAAALVDARAGLAVNVAALPSRHPRLRRSRLALAQALAASGDCAAAGAELAGIDEPYSPTEQPRLAGLHRVCGGLRAK